MKEQKRNITTSIKKKLHAQKDKQQLPCRRSAKLLVHTAATHILIKCNAKSLKNCELCIAYTLTINGSYDRIYMIYTESIAGHLASTIYTYLYCQHLRCRSTVGGSPSCAHYKCTPNIFVILVDLIGCYIVVCMTGPVYVHPFPLWRPPLSLAYYWQFWMQTPKCYMCEEKWQHKQMNNTQKEKYEYGIM